MKPGKKALRLAKAKEEEVMEVQNKKTEERGYMGADFIQATIPHRKTDELIYTRKNGTLTLTMIADPEYGMPYGSIPRMLLAFLTTEAVLNQSPVIELGDSLSSFMRQLDLVPTGGAWGSIPRLKDQIKRLFACNISVKDDSKKRFSIRQLNPVETAEIWWMWNLKKGCYEQSDLFTSTVVLRDTFYKELIERPVAFKMSALRELKQSPMAVDIYLWATHKNSYAKGNTYIKWTDLQMQFGAGYANTPHGKRNFKSNFLLALRQVAAVYPEVEKLRAETQHLIFVPGKPHVSKLLFPTNGE